MVANDPVTGRSVQRFSTVHGDAEQAEEQRRKLVECLGVDRSALYCEGAHWTLAELLERFVAANEHWRLRQPTVKDLNLTFRRCVGRRALHRRRRLLVCVGCGSRPGSGRLRHAPPWGGAGGQRVAECAAERVTTNWAPLLVAS